MVKIVIKAVIEATEGEDVAIEATGRGYFIGRRALPEDSY
jgi:hypothetical protein